MPVNRTSNPTPREVGDAGGVGTYDDMVGAVSAARVPPATAPAWTNITLDGFTTQALAFSTGDYIDLFIQTSHSVKLNQTMEYHIHWMIAGEDAGDEFQFQLTGVGAGIGGSFASIGTLVTGDVVLGAAETGKHHFTEFTTKIPALNTTVSSAYILRLERIAPDDGNDTAELIYVLFSDGHPEIDTYGSLQEDSKI